MRMVVSKLLEEMKSTSTLGRKYLQLRLEPIVKL